MRTLLLALPFLLAPGLGSACEVVAACDLEVEHAWSRASIGANRPGIVYVTIRNTGTDDDALVGVATPTAAMPMLHETVVTDGIAGMSHVSSVPVPAGETETLEPVGLHAMLNDLAAPLD